jgi:hypothetical protein
MLALKEAPTNFLMGGIATPTSVLFCEARDSTADVRKVQVTTAIQVCLRKWTLSESGDYLSTRGILALLDPPCR